MEQFLNEKITEAKREVDRLTHVCQTKPFDSADFFENEFQIERLAAQIEVYELIFKKSNRRKYRCTIKTGKTSVTRYCK
ncbi:hypothetical protein SSI_01184 [Enterococcus faecium EnGen0191]|nr:hypothetical protein SSI_01184 [Enterococcus faecium EnGen0191]